MKRILLYCLILGVLTVIPVEKLDVGELEPVQAVWAHKENGMIVLETDTDDLGEGKTVAEALADMKKRCPGIIYLDTAQFLLISEDAAGELRQLGAYLKDKVEVCLWDGQGKIQDAARYMSAHKNGKSLKEITDTDKLPKIERIQGEKQVENNDLTF